MGILNSFTEGMKNGQAELADYHNNFNKYIGEPNSNRMSADDASELGVYEKGNVSWINIALNRKMLDISNIDYFFVDRNGERVEWDKVPENLRVALDNGFSGLSLNDLLALTCGHEDLTGNSLWVKDTNVNMYSKTTGIPYQLIPIAPGKFKISTNKKGTAITKYTVSYADGTKIEYLPEDVIHFKRNPLIDFTPLIGVGLISQGRSLVNFEAVAMDYQTTFLEKDGTPDLIYIDKNMTNPMQAASKQKELVANYQNGKYSNSMMYAYGDIDIKGFSISSSDLQFIENRGMNSKQVISLMESTPIVLGDESGAGNYAIANVARNNYFGIVNSRAWHLLEVINKQYLWTSKGNEDKYFSLSCTPYAVGDIEQLIKAVQGGLISPAHASKELGYSYDKNDEASNALYISKGVSTLQSNFETAPVSFGGMLSDNIASVKKKTLIRDYQEISTGSI